jgi:hypothetical protein
MAKNTKFSDETTDVVAEKEVVKDIPPAQKKDTGEVAFLKRLLFLQHTGGFGHHLDKEINERIKTVEGK